METVRLVCFISDSPLFSVWTIHVNWVYEFANAYLVTQKFYAINCLWMSICVRHVSLTDRDTLLVHYSCKRPPKPSIYKTLIRSTPAITLSLTYCHLVPYRGWSNPGFLDAHQTPTNPWHFGWSLSLSGFSKKLTVEGEKNQVRSK